MGWFAELLARVLELPEGASSNSTLAQDEGLGSLSFLAFLSPPPAMDKIVATPETLDVRKCTSQMQSLSWIVCGRELIPARTHLDESRSRLAADHTQTILFASFHMRPLGDFDCDGRPPDLRCENLFIFYKSNNNGAILG